MIYLKDANIIFLKARKVAGTSFEIALSKFAKGGDIVTPITKEDEDIRSGLGFQGPQNYKKSLYELTAKDIYQWVRLGVYPSKFFNHISAQQVRTLLGADVFDAAQKIAIIRNPYDALVSYYHDDSRNFANEIDFTAWVRDNPKTLNINYSQYFIDGNNVIDRFVRYENLLEDTAKIEGDIPLLKGLSQTLHGIKAKSNIRPKDTPLSYYFSNDADLVASVRFFNSLIIEKFGYGLE